MRAAIARVAAPLLVVLGVLGCAATPPPPLPPPPPPVYVPPPPLAPPQPTRDQCGAGALQTLVGQPRTAIPVPVNPGARRVYCSTCPVTMDYAPGRLNIVYDEETGIVREVKCG
jgi:hypothetical protein